MRFRLIGAPGITHELCSYPAVLSSSYLPLLAFRTSTALSHRPSDQWFDTRAWPCSAYLRLMNLKKIRKSCVITYMCVATVCWFGWRINKDYSILFYYILVFPIMTAHIWPKPKHDLDLNFNPDLDLHFLDSWPTSTCRGRWGWVQWWPQQLQRRPQPQPTPPHPLDIVARSSFLVKGTIIHKNSHTEAPQPQPTPSHPPRIVECSSFLVKGTVTHYWGPHNYGQHLTIHLTFWTILIS